MFIIFFLKSNETMFLEYCNCHPIGSLRTSCDSKTSSCYCRPAVSGLSCSHCQTEYWAFSRIFTHNNTGCTRTLNRSKIFEILMGILF
jgi:hypothetical protein